MHRWSLDQEGICIQEGLHLGGWADLPPQDTTGHGQEAGGTHPTGMHTCSFFDHYLEQNSNNSILKFNTILKFQPERTFLLFCMHGKNPW